MPTRVPSEAEVEELNEAMRGVVKLTHTERLEHARWLLERYERRTDERVQLCNGSGRLLGRVRGSTDPIECPGCPRCSSREAEKPLYETITGTYADVGMGNFPPEPEPNCGPQQIHTAVVDCAHEFRDTTAGRTCIKCGHSRWTVQPRTEPCSHCDGFGTRLVHPSGRFLREARLRAKLSLREVARRTSLSPTMLCDLELGRRQLTRKHWTAIVGSLR